MPLVSLEAASLGISLRSGESKAEDFVRLCSSFVDSGLFLESNDFLLGNALVLSVFNTRYICLLRS